MNNFANFDDFLIDQVDRDIYFVPREPEANPELPHYEYTLFVFTKWNHLSNTHWDFPELENNWQWIGTAWLGLWKENQFSGPGPIQNVYDNEMLIRSYMNELVTRNVLTDYRIRYKSFNGK
jgi:hypothetical protein